MVSKSLLFSSYALLIAHTADQERLLYRDRDEHEPGPEGLSHAPLPRRHRLYDLTAAAR
jgi:hypothetical protein